MKNLRALIIGVCICTFGGIFNTTAQTVGISGSVFTPDADAILELQATDKGFLLPRMTSGERTAYTAAANSGAGLGAAEEGMTIYNSSTNEYNVWDGTQWIAISGTTSGAGFIENQITGAQTAADFWIDGKGVTSTLGIGTTAALSSRVHIHDASATAGQSLLLIDDNASLPVLQVQDIGRVGIGTATPLDELHVEGSIRMVDGNEAVGYVPVSDANGTMTWTDPSAIDDGDWTLVGFDIERQSGDVYIGNTNGTNNDLYISDRVIDWDNTARYLDPSATSQVNIIHYEVGSAATPAISFRVDNNSGIYQPAAGQIGWTINGTEGMRLNASRNLGIGSSNPTAGKVHINQTTTADALYITHTSASATGQVVNINKTANPSAGNDILQITVPAASPDDFQFVEFDRGGSVEFAVDGDGDVDFDGALEPSGDPGTVGQILRSGGLNASPTWVDASTIGSDITTASNGLTETGDDIQLGGTLTQNTTVTQGAFNMSFDLNSTGDFRIMDGGTTRARFEDGGRFEILGTTDASGTAGSGVLEIGNALRLDNNEIITNTNAILYINNDNGGDVSMDGTTFRMDASANRVGIGDVTPVTKLEIGDAAGQTLMLSRQDGTISVNEQLGGIGFDGSDGNTPTDIRESSASIIAIASEAHSATDKGGHLTFWTSPTNQDDNTDGFERMRVEAGGDIGIGTTNPAAKLQIDQNTTTEALNVRNTTNASTGRVVNIQRTQFPSAGNDMLQITVPAGSSNDFQFVEYDRGGTVEFAVDGDGDVDFNGALEPNGAAGTSGQFLRSGGTNASPTWVTIPGLNGDITSVTAGAGLTGGGTSGTVTVTAAANNGLNVDAGADRIQLGGALTENTTISQGAYSMNYNLNSTGDFNLQDNGTIITHFRDDGVLFHGDDMYWRDVSYTGTNLMSLVDDGNDGRLRIYENGGTSVDLDANTQFIFNEQGFDRDFRIESDDDANMFRLNANDNRVGLRVGGTPVTVLEIGHTGGQQLMLSRQDGTITAGEQLGGIGFDGSDGNTPDDIRESSAAIIAFASETHGTGDKGGHLTFWTSPTNQNDDTDGSERMRIEQNGEVGIGTTAPTQRLDVNGNVRIRGGAPAVGDVLTATNANGTADWQEANNGVKFVPFHSDAAGTNFWTHPDINVRVSFNNATEQVTFHNNSGGYWDAHIRGDNGSSASAPTAISNDVPNGGTLVLDLGSGSDGGFTVTAGDECCGTVQGFTMQMAYWSDNLSGLISYW